jgi:HSP20 family protein
MLGEYATAARWPDIFRERRRAQDEMNRLFGGLRFPQSADFPPVNVWAGADGTTVMAQVPGVNPDELDITVHQDTVTLRGKRDPEPPDADAPDTETIVHRQERPLGPFTRTIVLPFRVDADKVSARFDRGLLTLELPRPEADKPHQIKIARA